MKNDNLKKRVAALAWYGILENWDEYEKAQWLPQIVKAEEEVRAKRGLDRRLRNAKLGKFKSFIDFDWTWPTNLDSNHLEEVFDLKFIDEAANVVLCGPNGVGKTMIAKNLAYQAVLAGSTAKFVTASEMLNDLAAQKTGSQLTRKLKQYAHWQLLVIDEVGYLSTSNRHADLLFEVINRRYQQKSLILTTNRPFIEWGDVFPSATCVISMVDRLVHKAELINLSGDSYRQKEAKERNDEREARAKKRKRRKKKADQNEEDKPAKENDDS